MKENASARRCRPFRHARFRTGWAVFAVAAALLAQPVQAAKYKLSIAGRQVTDANKDDILGDGGSVRFSLSGTTGTLTLSNAAITSGLGDYVLQDLGGLAGIALADNFALTIVLEGANRVEYASFRPGIATVSPLTITGGGSLSLVPGEGFGIDARDDLTIDGATVSDIGSRGGGIECGGNLTITNANVTASNRDGHNGIECKRLSIGGASRLEAITAGTGEEVGKKSALWFKNGIEIGDGLVVSEPSPYWIDNRTIHAEGDDGMDGAKRVVIGPPVAYPVWVGGVQVTDANAEDIFGDGTAWFEGTATNGTLALSNAVVTNAYVFATPNSANLYAGEGFDLTVRVEGSNRLANTAADGYAVYAKGALAITGDGVLVGEEGMSGIVARGNLSIDGATVVAKGGNTGLAGSNVSISNATVHAAGWARGVGIPSGGNVSIVDSKVVATGKAGGVSISGALSVEGASQLEAEATMAGGVAVDADGGIEIGEGLAVVLPVGGGVSADGTTIVDAAGNTAERVVIAAPGTLLGSGTEADPYVVYDYATLVEFAQVVNGEHATIPQNNAAWAVVTNDITTTEADWTPIGTGLNDYFGTFDGAGHVISGLANAGTLAYAGLFGKVGPGGVVRNVRLAEVAFNGESYAGGVVGWNKNGGTVSNCCVSGSMKGESYAGGVAGRNGGAVANCYSTAKASVGDNACVGGVVGYNQGTVQNCHSTGAMSGGMFRGGVVGGNVAGGTVANCFYPESLGVGAIGVSNGGTVEGECAALSAAAYTNAASFKGWDFENVWEMGVEGPWLRVFGPAPVLPGDGTQENPYRIWNYEGLVAFAGAVNGGQNDAWGVLAADIAATEADWVPIGADYNYKGTFDGAGHTISGLENEGTPTYAGLFGLVNSGGVVRNVRLAGVTFNGRYAGGVAGYNNGTVSNCCVSGSVQGSYAGGVAGYNRGTVSNCYNTGAVSGGDDAKIGGVAGDNRGMVRNCHSTGAVPDGRYQGGVVGFNGSDGTVTNSYCLDGLGVAAIGFDDGAEDDCRTLSATAYTQTNSFKRWDFANVWEMGPEAPVLRGVSRVYPLWVDGKQVWDGNEADILGDGAARFAGTKTWGTLMLTNAVITNAVKYQSGYLGTAGIYAGDGFDLTISLDGSNQVTNANQYGKAILAEGNLSLGGAGSLTVKGGASTAGISVDGTLRIEDTTVAASSGSHGLSSGGDIVLSNATVSATGRFYGILANGSTTFSGESRVEATATESDGYAVYAGGGITVGAELRLVEPDGGGLANDRRRFLDAGGNTARRVLLESVEAYDLWVGGVQVCSTNAGDILGDGSARFEGTAAGGTLALSNAVITNAHYDNDDNSAGIYAGAGFDLTISLDGTNRVANAVEFGDGIHAKGNLSLGGAGSLTVESEYTGISADGSIVLTNATVSATGSYGGIYAEGYVAFAGECRVEATADNWYAVFAGGGITMEDRIGLARPVGGGVSWNGTTIMTAAGIEATNAIVAYFYDITVNEGSTTNSPSAAGFPVEIVANPPGDGKAFVQWSSDDGVEFVDAGAGQTWFTMPASNVTVTAVSAEIVITWEGETEYTYTGSAITPGFTVSLTNVDLHVGTNYVASWAGNTNAGTATVSVTLTNRPSGVQTNTFRIKPKPLEDGMVQLTVPDAGWWTYTGEALQPGFSLSDGNPSALTTNDLVLSWSNNVGPGMATAVFTGTNNYAGRVVKEFEIRWASETVDGTAWSYRSDLGGGTSATVTGADPAEGDVAVPETLGGLPVAGIGDGAFAGAADLTSITIPDGVADIGEEAFAGCTALTNVWIGTGIETVGTNAFAGCDALETLWLPAAQQGTGLLDAAGLPGTCEIHWYGTQVVTFDPNGGSCAVTTNACAFGPGKTYGDLPEAEWAGRDFLGWFDAADGGTEVAAADPVTEEVARTLYAHWQVAAANYLIDFDRNGGMGTMAEQVAPRGSKVRLSANGFSKEDCSFMGWAKTRDGAVAFADKAEVKDLAAGGGRIRLYAKWAKTKYAVAFAANGGTGTMEKQSMSWGKAAKLRKNAFKRKNSVFLGWAESKDGKVVYKNQQAVKNLRADGKTAKLYAKWAADSYAIRFGANGGTGTMADQVVRRGAKVRIAANRFARKGHTFRGWAKAKDGAVVYADRAAVKNLAAAGKTVTLHAKWAKTKYAVAFDANGGKGTMAGQTMTWGKAAKLRKNAFSRKDSTFIGWAKTKDGPVAYKDRQAVKNLKSNGKTVTLYAKWAKTNYTIEFDADRGKLPAGMRMKPQVMTWGQAERIKKNRFVREGCIFLGWSLTRKGAVAYADGAEVKNLRDDGKTVTFYARWAVESYGMEFFPNGGKGKMDVQRIPYGTAVMLEANRFSRSGYSFAGWAKSPDGPVVYRDQHVVKNLRDDGWTIPLYAKWKELPASSKGAKAAEGQEPWAAVTTSDGSDGSAVADGDEETAWSPEGTAGAWVVLSLADALEVADVEVAGKNLPEGTRILLSEDADDWVEDVPARAQYIWVLFPAGDEPPLVREIRVEE